MIIINKKQGIVFFFQTNFPIDKIIMLDKIFFKNYLKVLESDQKQGGTEEDCTLGRREYHGVSFLFLWLWQA